MGLSFSLSSRLQRSSHKHPHQSNHIPSYLPYDHLAPSPTHLAPLMTSKTAWLINCNHHKTIVIDAALMNVLRIYSKLYNASIKSKLGYHPILFISSIIREDSHIFLKRIPELRCSIVFVLFPKRAKTLPTNNPHFLTSLCCQICHAAWDSCAPNANPTTLLRIPGNLLTQAELSVFSTDVLVQLSVRMIVSLHL